jgi:Rieske Fe-S protein
MRAVARAGMGTQFAAFVSSARPPAAAPVAAAPAPQQASSTLGWLDDWTPEASGIFRIFRREPSRLPEMAADAGPLPPVGVPVPRGRLAPAGCPTP